MKMKKCKSSKFGAQSFDTTHENRIFLYFFSLTCNWEREREREEEGPDWKGLTYSPAPAAENKWSKKWLKHVSSENHRWRTYPEEEDEVEEKV